MNYRNIHARAASASETIVGCNVTLPPAAQALPRLRAVQNSPAQEFAARQGCTDPLPQAVIACILHRQSREIVGRDGISLTLEGKRYKFWSENSVTLATKQGQKVLVTYSRQNLVGCAAPVIHILSDEGDYIETLPLKGEVDWFDAEATARELAMRKRNLDRVATRLQHLHAPDTQAALDRTRHNESVVHVAQASLPASPEASSLAPQTKRVVQNFPLPGCNVTLPPAEQAAPRRAVSPLNQFPTAASDRRLFPEQSSPSSRLDPCNEDPAVLTGSTAETSRTQPPLLNGCNVTLPPAAQAVGHSGTEFTRAEAIAAAEQSANAQRAFHVEQTDRRQARARAITPEALDAFLSSDADPAEDIGPSGTDTDSDSELNDALEKLL